ncbi:MAG: hypothetical protein AAGC55_10560, partial [Myxococcota bacterium]
MLSKRNCILSCAVLLLSGCGLDKQDSTEDQHTHQHAVYNPDGTVTVGNAEFASPQSFYQSETFRQGPYRCA